MWKKNVLFYVDQFTDYHKAQIISFETQDQVNVKVQYLHYIMPTLKAILKYKANHTFSTLPVFSKFLYSVVELKRGPVWWPELKNSPTVTHACRKRRPKWVPSVWGYSWATLFPGAINTEVWSSRLGVGRWTNNPAP
jgi:hypothetical protein